ncbi:MAG: type pilus assembly transrane protein [Pseudomonadota bacterium]
MTMHAQHFSVTKAQKGPSTGTQQAGFSMVELMIAMTLGLLILAALVTLFINISRTNSEMAKMNSQIENGRFAMQILQHDVAHAGFWGDFMPQFNDLTWVSAPTDVPDAVPDPCLPHAAWTAQHVSNLVGIPLQMYGDTVPAGAGCVTSLASNKKPGTDVLVVRHADTCIPGDTNCEEDIAGKLYFQPSQCESNPQEPNTLNTIKLSDAASSVNDFYNGFQINIVWGIGNGQTRTITDYDGASRVATIAPAWEAGRAPKISSVYAFSYALNTDRHIFLQRDCMTPADKRKFVSNIYYVRNYANTAGDGIPTLMVSQFDLAGGVLAHQTAVPLIEGIEGFVVELGIDSISDTGIDIINDPAPNRYDDAVNWNDSYNLISPVNRGDGSPDYYVRCTAAVPCTAEELANVVAARIHVLARSDSPTLGYTDSKTYNLGDTVLGPFNDGYKRHVFSTSVRLNNVSGRRETP